MTVPQRVLDTMNSGLIYTCDDEEMIKAQKEQMELLYDFNATRPSQMTQRNEIARQLLGEFGEDAYIEPPLGANVTVLPGVTIGDNSVIGACSLVTKDIPANMVAFGQPCKVYREIGEHDDVYYWRDRMINPPYDQKQ